MSMERALVVEDDELGRDFVDEALRELGVETLVAENGREATKLLRRHDVDFVLSDLRMAELDGLGLLRWIQEHRPQTHVALMTAYGTLDVAVEAMRCGAEDILLKPFGPDQIALLLERLRRRQQLVRENQYLRREREEEEGSELVGDSPPMQEILASIRRIAPSKATVFLRGESGTGKEMVARAIHQASDRRDGPFIRVNCAALSESLLESELFGHEKGAFTGAVQRREGRFELAHRGTLLLDEVSEVSPRIQAKLLRVLEEEEFERVGGTRTLRVDVRVLATSNRDLEQAIRDGSFREDLFYRLHVVPLHLPPLRERRADIPLLVEAFLRRFARQNGRGEMKISPDALRLLQAHDWPGNVRELSNFVHRTVVLCTGPVIEARHLDLQEMARPSIDSGFDAIVGHKLEDIERELILRTLRAHRGNRTHAAEQLGLTARTICNKIRLYRSQGHEIPEPERAARRARRSGPTVPNVEKEVEVS